MWQDLWQDGSITGYYKGKAVIKEILQDSSLHDMEVTADDTRLYGDYTDATRGGMRGYRTVFHYPWCISPASSRWKPMAQSR